MDITASTIAARSAISGSAIFWTIAHDPAEDKTFDCLYRYQGVLRTRARISFALSGWQPLGTSYTPPTPLPVVPPERVSRSYDPTALRTSSRLEGEFFTNYNRRNWVAWSRIGEVNFELDNTGDAGWAPMSWQGWCYQLKVLGNKVIAYGANGITALTPNPASMSKHLPPTFGKTEMYQAGVLAKNAVCGNDKQHFFIDALGQLCQLVDAGVKVIGYAEYLRPMKFAGKPVLMFYEHTKQWVYICNGQKGYIYTPSGMGGGPKNLTGISYLGVTPILIANGPLEYDLPWFTTELFDMGQRDIKSCYELAISTSTPKVLKGMVEYRYDIKQPFQQTPWLPFNAQGRAFPNVSGVEFRVHVKAEEATDLEIDDFKIYTRLFDRTLKQTAFPG